MSGLRATMALVATAALALGCARRPLTPAEYVSRYEASCPGPPDTVWVKEGTPAFDYSTPDLKSRAKPLVARLEAIRAQLDHCASLPGLWPRVEVAPTGTSFDPPTARPDCASDACFREVLTAAQLEQSVQSPIKVKLALKLKPTPDPRCSPKPENTGTVDKGEVGRLIHGHAGELRECYESAMDAWGVFKGRVTTTFEIGNDGKVVDANVVLDDTPVQPLGCCIVSSIKRWRFPRVNGSGSVIVTYPWVFKTSGK
ncbi:MAG: AgmX/PglI C-terminal domain-containing protein [Myxococcales bacterium]